MRNGGDKALVKHLGAHRELERRTEKRAVPYLRKMGAIVRGAGKVPGEGTVSRKAIKQAHSLLNLPQQRELKM